MQQTTFTYSDYEEAVQVIFERTSLRPKIAIILGSGLGPLADEVENPTIIPTNEIPHWPRSTVHGHKGRLVIGYIENQPVMVMQGRVHYYEGYSMQQVTFPIRVMQLMGIETLIVTNAAGGINTSFSAGDLMLIEDHINLLGHMGHNALIGPNDERLGERFPIFTVTYDKALREHTMRVARELNIHLQKGVYLCLSGPAFETPAEIRMFRAWGADAVGMSTAPEVTVARHGGIRVLGISSITNISIDHQDVQRDVSHEEVLEVGAKIVPNLMKLIRGVLQNMP
ncbi:MAG: purine-nucleoside phosphorylase [Phototrophicales bacterium]|nr:MAG: purine-nucleoside phosphorylase [Phototrophicales bacterium]